MRLLLLCAMRRGQSVLAGRRRQRRFALPEQGKLRLLAGWQRRRHLSGRVDLSRSVFVLLFSALSVRSDLYPPVRRLGGDERHRLGRVPL